MKMRVTGMLAMTCVGLLVLQANAAEPRRGRSGREEGRAGKVAAEKKAVSASLWKNLDRAIRLNDVDASRAAEFALQGAYGASWENIPGAIEYAAALEEWIASQTPKYPATNKVLIHLRELLAGMPEWIASAKAKGAEGQAQPAGEGTVAQQGRPVAGPAAAPYAMVPQAGPAAAPAAPAPATARAAAIERAKVELVRVIVRDDGADEVEKAIKALARASGLSRDSGSRERLDFCDQTLEWLGGINVPENLTLSSGRDILTKSREEARTGLKEAERLGGGKK